MCSFLILSTLKKFFNLFQALNFYRLNNNVLKKMYIYIFLIFCWYVTPFVLNKSHSVRCNWFWCILTTVSFAWFSTMWALHDFQQYLCIFYWVHWKSSLFFSGCSQFFDRLLQNVHKIGQRLNWPFINDDAWTFACSAKKNFEIQKSA